MMKRIIHAFSSYTTRLVGVRQKLGNRWLRRAFIGLGVLIPSVAIAGTVCFENVFAPGGTKGYTAWFSEETSGWQAPANGFFHDVNIRGSYADDFQLGYETLNTWEYSRTAESAEIKVSEEEGERFCPQDQWMTSIRTTGKYSDNMHFKCAGVNKGAVPLKWGNNYKVGPFSDEVEKNLFTCPPYMALTGIACKGSYCDNMWFTCRFFKQ